MIVMQNCVTYMQLLPANFKEEIKIIKEYASAQNNKA